MIREILVSSLRQMARDRATQGVSFIVPIEFFSIMVSIMGDSGDAFRLARRLSRGAVAGARFANARALL